MGGKEGASGETGTCRRQESRCQKGGGEDGTKGVEVGCGQGCRPGGGTKEVRTGKGGESSGQEGREEVGNCGISTDAGSRGAVGFVHGGPRDGNQFTESRALRVTQIMHSPGVTIGAYARNHIGRDWPPCAGHRLLGGAYYH